MSTVASERHNDDDLSVPTADPPTTSSPRTTRTHDAADVVELNADATKSCGSPKALLPTQNPVKISENLSCVEYLPAFRAVFVGCARLLHILEVIPVVGIDLGKLSSASPLANHTPSHGASRGGAGALPLPTQRPFVLQHIGSVGNVQRIEALQCYPSDREATVAFVQYGRCATIIMDVLQYRPAARDKHTSFFVHQHVKGKILHAATTVGAGSMAHAVVAPSLGNQSQCNSATSLPSSHARLPGGGATTKATAFAERQQQGPLAQQLIMLSIDLGGVLVDKLAWDPHHPYTLALSSPHTHFELWQVPTDGTKVFPPTLVLRPPAHKTRSEVRDMAFSPSDPNLIFIITDASSAGELILYDRRHVETPQRIPLVGPGLSMAFHPLFSDLLAVCYRQGKTKSDCRIEFLSIKGGGADAMRPLPSHAVPPPSGGGGGANNNNNNDGGRESTAAAAASGMIISAQCEWVEEIAPLDYFATINRLRWRPTSFCRLSTPNPDHHYLSYVPSPEMLAATIREQSTNAMLASPSADHANINRSWAASSGRGSPVYRGASSTNNNNNNVSSSGQLSIAGLHAVASQLWFGVSTNTDVSISVWDAVHTYSPICQVKYPGEVNEPTDFVWVNEVTIITVHRNGHVYITSLLNSMAVSEGIEQQHVGATRMEAVGFTTLDSSWTSPLRLPPPVRTTGFLERVVSSLAEQSPMMAVGGPQMLSDAQVAEVLDLLYRCYSRDEMVEVCSMLFILPTVSMDVDFFGRSFAVRNSAESQRTYYRRTLRRECAQLAVRMMVQLHYENQRRGQPAMSSAEAEGRSCSFNTQPLPEMLQPRSLTEDGGAMDLARPTAFVSTPITTATARQHQQQQPQQQHDADPTSSRVTPPMPLAEVEAPRPSSISPSMPHANPTRRATSVVAPPSSPSFFARLWGLVNPAAAEAPRRGGIRGRRRGASTPSTRGVPPPISTAVALSSPRTAINTSTAATSAIPIANACVGRADPNSATLASHTLVANATLRSDVASVGGADVCSQHLLTSPPQQHGGGGDAWRSAEFSWISDVEPRAAAPPSMCFATILPLITSSTNNTHADRRDAAMLRMQAASPPILLSPDGSSSAANNMSCQSTYTLADRIPSPMSPLPARSSSAQPPTASILKWPTTPTPPTSATQHRVAASTTEEASREVSSASAKSTPHVEELSATTSARQTLSAANTNNNNSQRINIRGNAKRVIRLASGRGPPVIESFVCSREVSGWAYTERRYEEDLFAQFALEWEMGYELALAMKHQRHRRDDAAERKKSSFYALDGWASNTSARGLRLSELEEDDPATTSPHHIDNIFANMMIRNARICADALRACEWEKVERDIRRVHGDAGGQPARHQLDSWRSLGVFLLSEGRSKRAGEDAAPSAAAGASPATGDPRSQWWMAAAHAWRTHDVSVIVVVATSQLQYASLVGDVQFALVLYILFCLWWRMRFGSYEPRSEEGAETDEKMHGRTTTHTTTTTTSSSSASSPAAANRSSSGAAQSMVRLSVPCPLLPEKVDESAMTCSAPDADATNNNNNNGHAVDGRPPYVPVRRRCFESPLSSAPASPPPAESVGELHNDCSPEEWRTRALQWLEAYTDNLYARKLYVPLNELLLIIPEILQEPSNPVQPRASEIAYEKQTTYVFCGAAGCTAVKSELLSRLPPPHSHLSMNALRGDGGGLHRRRKQHRGVLRSSSRDSLDSHSSEYSSDGLHAASTSEEDEVSIASLSDVTEVMDVGSLSHSRGSTTNNNNNMHAHHHPHLRSDDSFVGAQTSRIQVPSADVRPPRRVGAAVWRGSGGVVVAEAGSVGQDEGTTISRSVEAGGGVVVHAMDVLASHDATLPRGAFCPTCSGTELMTCVFCEEVVEGMFYWMRSCGHGAHVEHMEEWLATSNECPKCGVPISTATCNTL